MNNIDKKIKDYRNSMGFTQEQFADILGIKKSLLGAYEEGRATPPIDKLINISEEMGVSLDQLLEKDQPINVAPRSDQQSLELNFNKLPKERISFSESIGNEEPQRFLKTQEPENINENKSSEKELLITNLDELKAFENLKDSPINGAIVFGKPVKLDSNLEFNKPYIIITKSESLYRIINNFIANKNSFVLSSELDEISPTEINLNELKELYSVESYYLNSPPKASFSEEKVLKLLNELKNSLNL